MLVPMPRPSAIPFACLILALAQHSPAQTLPTTRPAAEPIPPQQLDQMYRRELGPLYRPQDANLLLSAHALIERFFATNSPADRKQIIRQIESTGIDPN